MNHGARDWDLGGQVIARFGGTQRSYTFPAQTLPAGAFLPVTSATLGFSAEAGDRLVLYAADQATVLDAVVVKDTLRGRYPDGVGPWLVPAEPTPGARNAFALRDEIVINEIMYHHRPMPATPAVYGPTNLVLGFNHAWRYHAEGVDLGTAWRAPDYDDRTWPSGAGLLGHETCEDCLEEPIRTPLTLGPSKPTFYFRTRFGFAGEVAGAQLVLRLMVDDGAVVWLNGAEVWRARMPAGDPTFGTLASPAVDNAAIEGPFVIPLTSLRTGDNVLAVEVHQQAPSSSDLVFGAELSAVTLLAPAMPRRDSPEAWIELFNRGSNTVDLTGWRLDEGIDYRFAAGKTIAPGGYLVVAKDVAHVQAFYPGLDVVGSFTNKLSKKSDLIVLKDANNNPADEVRYFDGGRWPEAANGGGSSLELRDPWADNTSPEAWAASDEGAKSSWVWFTNRAVVVASAQPTPAYQEFVLGLLDSGECLIDDLRLVESPTNAPISLLQNGTFTGGLGAWRIIGNHAGSVVPDPSGGGNDVLNLLATGPTEYLHNHAETTLKNGSAYYTIVNGRQYEYSFRARWISGNNLLNARLWMNRVPRTFALPVPALNGTPGALNSRAVPNLGPTFALLRHTRTVPLAGEPVTVSVEARDPQGVASATLFYSVNSGAWNRVPMTAIGGDTFTGAVPGASAGAVVNFCVQAADLLGATALFPAAGTNSRALCHVDDGRALPGLANNLRIVMTPADSGSLLQPTNLMSNDRLGGTVIWNEEEVYYDLGVRLKGSEHGRPDPNRLGFFLDFRPDQLFRGVHDSVGVDRSGGWRFGTTFGQDEILIKHITSHAGGLPQMYDDLIRLITPRTEHTGPAILQLARYGDVFLDSQYRNGGNGTAFEYELLYGLGATTGGPEGLKTPQEGPSVAGVPLASLGDDKEAYRLNFIIKNNRDADDFNGLVAALKAIGQPPGANFDSATAAVLDVDEWLRAYAVSALCNPGDNYGGDSAQHNLMLYTRPEDNRTLFLIWDTDFAFVGAATESITENSDLNKFIANPANRRRYYEHLFDIIATTFNTGYMSYWTDHYDNFLPGQNFATILTYIGQRANYVLSQLPTNAPFAITSNGGADFGTTNGILALRGTAPIQMRFIEINGVFHPITWTSVSNWTVTLPLYAGVNALVVQGVDSSGLRRTNLADTITVTNSGPGALLPVVINEWMADNRGPGGVADPADGLFQDWFELFNPNPVPVNLSGFTLTDTLASPAKWTVPADVLIGGRGFLLVWADNQTNQNGLGPSGDLHANFQLNNSGEAIGLYSPNGVLQHGVAFGPQLQNISQGLFPDGDTNTLYSMTNWTPRAANQPGGLPASIISEVRSESDAEVSITFTAIPNRTYYVESADDLTAPFWFQASSMTTAIGSSLTATCPVKPGGRGFFRIVLLK